MPPSAFNTAKFQVSAPAVVPLFGDQQHYLGLPLVTLAVSLRYSLSAERRADRNVVVERARDRSFARFPLHDLSTVTEPPHTPRGILQGLDTMGIRLASGYDFVIQDTGAEDVGLDTSSARTVCWVAACMAASGVEGRVDPLSVSRIARQLAAAAGPDQATEPRLIAAVTGAVLFFESDSLQSPPASRSALQGFVIGHTEPTPEEQLAAEKCQQSTLAAVYTYAQRIKSFDFRLAGTDELFSHLKDLPQQAATFVFGHILNRDTCIEAIQLLGQPNFEPHELGRLLDDQHAVRRDYWALSSPRSEELIDLAKRAGALGCSGHDLSGGIIAYAPRRQRQVARAIEKGGGIGVAVNSDTGLAFGQPELRIR
jgi:galactokinase